MNGLKEIDFGVAEKAVENSELTAEIALASEKVISEGRTHEAETHITLADPSPESDYVVLVDSHYEKKAYQVGNLAQLQGTLEAEIEAHEEHYTEHDDLEPAHEVTNPDLLAEFEMTVPA